MSEDPMRQRQGDLLYGVPSIAAFLGVRTRQASHRIASGSIPTFKIGKSICARRSSLAAWLRAQETPAEPTEASDG
jgi:hypothetical protein